MMSTLLGYKRDSVCVCLVLSFFSEMFKSELLDMEHLFF